MNVICTRCGNEIEEREVGSTSQGMKVVSHNCLEILDDDGEGVELVCPNCMTQEELTTVWDLVGKSPERLRDAD
jgi:DNA-directed RNA polymerase subunit RPC12/RpoP